MPARQARIVLMLLVMLAAASQISCGQVTGTATEEDCGKAPTTSRPRVPRHGPTGAAGSAAVQRHSAPPPAAASPPPSPPTPVNGRVALTAANTLQTIVVPAGTIIEVRLEPDSGSVWTVPESSDPQALPRLSSSGACDPVKVATFRADGTGEISATRPHGSAQARLIVTISAQPAG
ncbi:MAG TPA: hypothetical protein VFC19_34600 [Candidatus Limnocylindrales bacterium]|nr:hypothetical protein [Candidatus Limnocylindrales bacterium]